MKNFSIALIITLLILALGSIFVVKEGQRGMVMQFGKIKTNADGSAVVYEPGLQFKLPFVETVKVLDARIQTLDETAVQASAEPEAKRVVLKRQKMHLS